MKWFRINILYRKNTMRHTPQNKRSIQNYEYKYEKVNLKKYYNSKQQRILQKYFGLKYKKKVQNTKLIVTGIMILGVNLIT